MKINIKSEDVFKIANDNLVSNTPFLAIRFGDAEAILLENTDEKQIIGIFRKQLGTILEKKDIDVIRRNLIETVNNTDLLGLPDYGHINAGGYWSKSIDILNKNCSINTNKFSSIDFHYETLRNWDSKESCYDLLLNNLPELYIISCRNINDGLFRRFKINKIESIIIPPQFIYEEKVYTGIPHYPDRFLEIKDKIQSMGDLKGKLLLYGAGFVGKIYGLFWKNNGGVAIDIGSVFDRFAGKLTRGKGKGATAIDLTYKL